MPFPKYGFIFHRIFHIFGKHVPDALKIFAYLSTELLEICSKSIKMVVVCEVPGCGQSFSDKKTLTQHQKSKHRGYTYYCGGCGHGPVSRSATLTGHRVSHDVCRGAPGLEFRPLVGFYQNGRPYAGALPPSLQLVQAGAQGEPLGELGELSPREIAHLGEAHAELVADARQREQAPERVLTRGRQTLPLGVFCTQCPLDATGMYLRFADTKRLIEHLFDHHTDMPMPTDEEMLGDSASSSGDEESSDDDDAGDGNGEHSPMDALPVLDATNTY